MYFNFQRKCSKGNYGTSSKQQCLEYTEILLLIVVRPRRNLISGLV